jgi:type I restriction enzyme, S subunit
LTVTHPVFGTQIPNDWTLLRVDDIRSPEPSSCVAGPFGSNISSKYFVDEGVPVIRGGNLTDDLTPFVPTGFVYVSKERAQSYQAQHVRAGDLVFTCWGTIGQVGRIPEVGPYPEYIISNKQLKLRPDPVRIDSHFLYYYFANPQMVEHIKGRTIGSAVPGINLGILKALPVVVPPLQTQRKIAAVLSAYDELIENNNRRITLLEEMAQRIYREWFVDFRYPGHDGVPLADSELGPIPQDWEVIRASDALEVNPKIAYDQSAARAFVPMTSVSETTMHITPLAIRVTASGSRFENGDTLFARITPCLENGKTAFVQCLARGDVASGSTEFIVLRGKRVGPEFVYLLARSTAFRDHAIKSMSGATGRQRVRESCFDNYLVPVPPYALLSDFSQVVGSMFSLSYKLFSQNQNLRTTRDLLLPRLISGDINVDDRNIEIPDTA